LVLWFALVAADTASPQPPPIQPPTPTPNGYINLNPPAGPAGTTVVVTGSGWLANEPVSIYWDSKDRVVASAKADGSGNFSGNFQAPDDKVASHNVCVSQPAVSPPCAQFNLEPKPSPSPTPTPSPSEQPSPSPSPSPTPTAVAQAPSPPTADVHATGHVNGLSLLLEPPFVFLPLIGALMLVVALGIWVRSRVRLPEPEPEANVSHHRVRQEAEFTPPDDLELPPAPGFRVQTPFEPPKPPAPPEPPPPQVSPPPPAPPPPPRPAGADEPPDLPEPGE
jgi:hypothetical protein